jgi:hypothetical protein
MITVTFFVPRQQPAKSHGSNRPTPTLHWAIQNHLPREHLTLPHALTFHRRRSPERWSLARYLSCNLRPSSISMTARARRQPKPSI